MSHYSEVSSKVSCRIFISFLGFQRKTASFNVQSRVDIHPPTPFLQAAFRTFDNLTFLNVHFFLLGPLGPAWQICVNVQSIKTVTASRSWHIPAPARERASASTGSLRRTVQVRSSGPIQTSETHSSAQDSNRRDLRCEWSHAPLARGKSFQWPTWISIW